MFRSGLVATLSALVLTGCVTSYAYRNDAGQGDYYYSEPDIDDSDLYGLPYGGYGYSYGPGAWYGGYGRWSYYGGYGFPYFYPYGDGDRRHHHGGGRHHNPPPAGGGGNPPPGGGGPLTEHDNDGNSNDVWFDPRRGRRHAVTPQIGTPAPGMPSQGGMPHVRPTPSAPTPMPRAMPRPAPSAPVRTERPEREFRREPVR